MKSALKLPVRAGVWWALASVLTSGCANDASLGCRKDEDCPIGYLCTDKVCLEVCQNSAQCARNDQKCEDGFCQDVLDPECSAHEECVTPPPCRVAETPQCLEGVCQYAARTCSTPPADGCDQEDAAYRTYAASGICNADNGECEHELTELPCPDCAQTCAPDRNVCVIYVNGASSAANPSGQSWETAFRSIQDAMQAAPVAIAHQGCAIAELWVAQGTYHVFENSPNDTLALQAKVHLYGGFVGQETFRVERNPRDNPTTISGSKADDTDNAYHVVTGSDDAVLDGFVVSDGVSTDMTSATGGGVLNMGASPTIRNCRIQHNQASEGGGMYNGAYAAPLILDTTFVDNEATGYGGAMANADGAMPYVRGVVFAHNAAGDGGAIHNLSATSFVRDSVFVANQVRGDGGGITNAHLGYADVDGCLFSDNVGNSEGGAIIDWSNYAGTYIANSIFASNYSGNGSAMSVWDGSRPEVRNCVFVGNTTAGRGGAIYAGFTDLSVFNSTFVCNVSTDSSAAVELGSALLVMANAVLWNNDPADLLVDQAAGNVLTHNIYDGADPSLVGIVASGTWSSAAAYDGQELQTTLTDGSASWEPATLAGMFVRPVATGTRFLPIIANDTQHVIVWGDLGGIIAAGTSYQVWDLGLSGTSPGVDGADASYAPIYDLNRNPRVDVSAVNDGGTGEPPYGDIGAYERLVGEPSIDQWRVDGCSAATAFRDSGHLYFFCASALSWPDARASCRQRGLHLATIRSPEEQMLVASLSSLPSWVGGQNGDSSTRWAWETGEPWGYTYWGAGQPGDTSDRCLQIDNAGNWESTYCDSTDAFVCEYSP